MPINPNISLGFKPADPFTTIGSMLNIANAQQQYQQAQQLNPLQVQAAQEQLRQALAINPQLLSKATTEARVAEATAPSQISTAASQARGAEAGAELAGINTANARVQGIAGRLTGLINNPLIIAAEQNPSAIDPAQLADVLKKYGQEQASALGIAPEKANDLIAPYIEQASTNPAGTRRFLMEKLLSTLEQGARVSALQPSGVPVSTGAQGYVVQTNMFGPQPGGIIPGTGYENQPPPTTPIVNPQTGEGSILGTLSQRTPAPVVTSLSGTQAGAIKNFNDYSENLTKRVETSNQVLARTDEVRNLLNEFKPGAGTGTRQNIAQRLQAIGAPQELVDQVSGGNLGAQQAFNKFMAASVMTAARQAAAGDQARVSEIDNFIKNNPTIDSDPRTLQRFIDFTEKQAKRDVYERDLLDESIRDKTFNASTWQSDLQKKLREKKLLPQLEQAVKPPRTVTRTGTFNGRPVVQYFDGSVEYK